MNLMNFVIDTLANSNSEEEAKEKVEAALVAKRNPELAKQMAKEHIQSSFEEDLNEIIKEHSNDVLMLDLMCKASIASNIQRLKSSEIFQILSGKGKAEYDLFIEGIANEVINKYFE